MRVEEWFPLVGLSLLVSGCFGGSYAVTRVVDGREVVGPFVSDKAYALYLQGATLETEGKNTEALATYELALRHDPESPDLWTRVGAVRCALGESPWAAFERATRLDSQYEAAWVSLANCHLHREEYEAALEAARKAVEVEPKTIDNVVLFARVLELVGKAEEAGFYLDELVVREPLSVEAHRARLELAIRTGDAIRKEASARRLYELAPASSQDFAEQVPSLLPLARIDEALLNHDLESARELALSARISSGMVALRAVALGRLEEAEEEADLALAANPDDSDARIALAMVAHLKNEEAALAKALSNIPTETMPLSPVATRLLGELIRMRAAMR